MDGQKQKATFFKKKALATTGVSDVEWMDGPIKSDSRGKFHLRVWLMPDVLQRMMLSDDPFDEIEHMSQRFRRIGCVSIEMDDMGLIVGYRLT